MTYGKSKDLATRTQSDKVLKDKAFKIASDPKFDGYQRGFNGLQVFLINNLVEVVLPLSQIINLQVNFIRSLIEHLRDEKFIHHLEIISECRFS